MSEVNHPQRIGEMVDVFTALTDDWRDYPRDALSDAIDPDIQRMIGKYMDWADAYIDDDSPLADAVALLRAPPLVPEAFQSANREILTVSKARTSLLMIVAKLKRNDAYQSRATSGSRPSSISVRVHEATRNPRAAVAEGDRTTPS